MNLKLTQHCKWIIQFVKWLEIVQASWVPLPLTSYFLSHRGNHHLEFGVYHYQSCFNTYTTVLVCWGFHNKALQTGQLRPQTLFLSQFWRLSPRSRCWQGQFLPRLLSLVCGWLSPPCILFFSAYAHAWCPFIRKNCLFYVLLPLTLWELNWWSDMTLPDDNSTLVFMYFYPT